MSYWRKPGEQNPPIPFIDAVCRFYSNVGHCRNGDSCSYFHQHPDHRRGWKNYPKNKVRRVIDPQQRDESRRELETKISDSKAKLCETIELVAPLVMKDMEVWEKEKLWTFTSYGLEGGKSLSEFRDKSYEEIRWEMMRDPPGGLVMDGLVNRYDTIIRTRRLFSGSLSSTENALMLTHNLPDKNPFDPSVGDIDFDDLNALSRDDKTEQMSLVLFGTKTLPNFGHIKVRPARSKNRIAQYGNGGWEEWKPPRRGRVNWTRPTTLDPGHFHHQPPLPPWIPPPPPMPNGPLRPHQRNMMGLLPLPGHMQLRPPPHGHRMAFIPNHPHHFRPQWQGQRPPSAPFNVNHGTPMGGRSEAYRSDSGPGNGNFEANKENTGIPLALQEMHHLRMRNQALEARLRAMLQNSPGENDEEVEGNGDKADKDSSDNHSFTAHFEVIDLQSQIDDLFQGNNAMEAGIRGIRESLVIPGSPTPVSSPAEPVGRGPVDISHRLPMTLDLGSPPPPPPLDLNVTPTGLDQHEKELCGLMSSLRVSPPRAPSSSHEESKYVKPPDCIIS